MPVLLPTGRVEQAASNLAPVYPHVALASKPSTLEEFEQCFEAVGRAKWHVSTGAVTPGL